MHKHAQTYTGTTTIAYTPIHMYICTHPYINMYTCTHPYINMYTYTPLHMYTHNQAYTHKHTYNRMHIHILGYSSHSRVGLTRSRAYNGMLSLYRTLHTNLLGCMWHPTLSCSKVRTHKYAMPCQDATCCLFLNSEVWPLNTFLCT